jgi:molecular chaperone Hsp33
VSNDVIHRFSFTEAPIRGQWVRLEQTLATVLGNQPYPPELRAVLGEMLAAVSLMADGIKFRGAVALQARGTGPVTTVLAECREQHLLRGIARWDHDANLAPAAESLATLLGQGQMAVSLLPDAQTQPDAPAYQGIVGLTEGSLAANLEDYFATSEQLPTRLMLVCRDGRVTGLLLQRLPASPRATEFEVEEHEALWREALLLAGTLQPEELAGWPVTELLHKLFHEHALTLQPGRALQFSCTCSRERAERMLAALPKREILELLAERGAVDVTCEICGARYEYDQIDTRLVYETEPPRVH